MVVKLRCDDCLGLALLDKTVTNHLFMNERFVDFSSVFFLFFSTMASVSLILVPLRSAAGILSYHSIAISLMSRVFQ